MHRRNRCSTAWRVTRPWMNPATNATAAPFLLALIVYMLCKDWRRALRMILPCLALSAMGNDSLAAIVFSWIQDRKFEDNTFWCGYTHPDITIWPEEKMTWTNAVILMAADALYELTPGGKIFNHRYWESSVFSLFTRP